jgi:GNAT superfamily N-acetyltransferase
VTAVEVRRASVADVRALAALRRVWVEENESGPVDDAAFDAEFDAWFAREHEQRVTWLAEVDGEPVGMLNVLVFTRMPRPGQPRSQWAYLANFFVLAEHRGAGVGSRLLGACTGYADAHQFARIVLRPTERSVSVDERAGFRSGDDLLVRRYSPLG